MAGYGTYQGVEKALSHVSNTFSNVMEMKQRQKEKEDEKIYRNKIYENVTLPQAEREKRTFDITSEQLKLKLEEDKRISKEQEYLAKQKETERIQDATPRPLSQEPFLNFVESFSPEAVNQIKNDMKMRGYIREGAGGFNVVNFKQYLNGLDKDVEGKQRMMSFMATGRQDLENASAKLKAVMSDPKTKAEQMPGIQQKLQDIGSKLTWVTAQGTELEKHIKEEQEKLQGQKDLETQKQAGAEDIEKMRIESAEKIAGIKSNKTTDVGRERLILSYLNQAKAAAIKATFANKPDMVTKLLNALSGAQTEEQQNTIMSQAETQMDEKQTKIYDNVFKSYIHKNAPDDIVGELTERWKRKITTEENAPTEYTDEEKQQVLELLRKRGRIE